jgi:hypothetical protein
MTDPANWTDFQLHGCRTSADDDRDPRCHDEPDVAAPRARTYEIA